MDTQHISEVGRDIAWSNFASDYVSKNEPLVIRDALSDWPAIHRWSVEYLNTLVGYHEVDVETSEAQFQGRVFTDAEKVRMPFSEFLRRMEQPQGKSDYFVGSWLFPTLVPDVRSLQLEQAFAMFYKRRMLMSRGGNRIALHHDWYENLLCQISGTKVITILDVADTANLYPLEDSETPNYSPIDVDKVNLNAYPRFADANPLRIELRPGDAIYIPSQCWHAVSSYQQNIAISVAYYEHNCDLLGVLRKLLDAPRCAIPEDVANDLRRTLDGQGNDAQRFKKVTLLAEESGCAALLQRVTHRSMLFVEKRTVGL